MLRGETVMWVLRNTIAYESPRDGFNAKHFLLLATEKKFKQKTGFIHICKKGLQYR